MDELRAILSKRSDGRWELLATAAGDRQSVSKTLMALSAPQLHKGALGLAVAPSVIRDRVEALAAHSVDVLRTLAQEWIAPREIQGHPFWAAAWNTSLRHLKGLGAVTFDEANVPELSEEVSVLWGECDRREVSWKEVSAEVKRGRVLYDTVRMWSRCQLKEQTLTSTDVADAPRSMLRLLRGREHILDASARRLIAGMALEVSKYDPFEGALLVELSRSVSPDVGDQVREKLIEWAHSASDPRPLIPVAYVLLDSGWRVP